MNDIKDYSFLLLEEIPLKELPVGVAEIVDHYRYKGTLTVSEAMDQIEEIFKDEMIDWIQTNQELSQIFSEEED